MFPLLFKCYFVTLTSVFCPSSRFSPKSNPSTLQGPIISMLKYLSLISSQQALVTSMKVNTTQPFAGCSMDGCW